MTAHLVAVRRSEHIAVVYKHFLGREKYLQFQYLEPFRHGSQSDRWTDIIIAWSTGLPTRARVSE